MYQATQQEAQTNAENVSTENSDSTSGAAKKEEVEDADFEVVEDEK